MPLPSKAGAYGAGLAILIGAAGGAALGFAGGGDHSPAAARSAANASHTINPVSLSGSDHSSARAVYAHAKDSVAFISSQTPEGQATGSGFVVSDDGKVITNEHVVDGAQQVTVKLGTSTTELSARVLAADASKDLALLQVDTGGKKLTPLALADSSKIEVGQTTYAIGNPYGLDHTFTSGIVSALDREIQAPDGTPIKGAIQTDAAINPGNSGGALLDENGDVIGVNSQIAAANSGGGGQAGNVGIGFAIASNTVADFIKNPTSSQAAQPQEQQVDPNGQQIDPQQSDPWGDQQQADPYGDQQADPYGYQQTPEGDLGLGIPQA